VADECLDSDVDEEGLDDDDGECLDSDEDE
jgi:hypothetical protein